MRIPVILESPYAGEVQRNKAYLQLCILDCVNNHNESPFAGHQMFTDAFDDRRLKERELCMKAAKVWHSFSRRTVVYTDFGISRGMKIGIAGAEKAGRSVEMRTLPHFNLKVFYTEFDQEMDTPWVELFAREQQRQKPLEAPALIPLATFVEAQQLLEEINELAGAGSCYRNDAEHDEALMQLIARKLHEAKTGFPEKE